MGRALLSVLLLFACSDGENSRPPLHLGDGDFLVAEDVAPVVVGFLILGGDGELLEGEVLGDVIAHGIFGDRSSEKGKGGRRRETED